MKQKKVGGFLELIFGFSGDVGDFTRDYLGEYDAKRF
jgi:hypothetical protein